MSGAAGGLGAGFSYQKFVHFALEQTRLRSTLDPHPSQEKFKFIKPNEDNTVLNALSFSTSKIRLLRSLTIEQRSSVQVLDFAAFSEPEYDLPIFCVNAFSSPARSIVVLKVSENGFDANKIVLDFAAFSEPEYDLPIFCANAFSSTARSIVVLDLNPLYDTTEHKDYRGKYYRNLMPLIHKYSELLPWGGKITSESLRFFSPAVIWTMFEPTEANHQALYSAFMDYYKAWLEFTDGAVRETSKEKIDRNREAQHKYLTWRAEKDPGYPLLKKLIGESGAKDLVREFLFEGVDSLGTKSFLEYFPEYAQDDGTVNRKRSMAGKSFEKRPWDAHGRFVGDAAVDG